MIKQLRRKAKSWVGSPHLLPWITLASFLESIIVPIPIETLLIPLSQLRRDRIWHIATLATLGCILGALVAYSVGYWIVAQFETNIINWFGDPQTYQTIIERMNEEGFWFIVLAGIAPIPLQLAMLAAGATAYPVGWFVVAIAISRILRYFGIAYLVYAFGDRAEMLLRQYKMKAVLALSAIIITIWLTLHFLLTTT